MRNLLIDELFIGAWVQQYHAEAGTFSCPMRVTGIHDGGSLYLECQEHEGDPFDAMVSDVLPLPMDEYSMRGFGFVKVAKGENVWMKTERDIRLTVSLRHRHGAIECRRAAISGRFACWNEEIRCIHELQRWWIDKVLLPYGIGLHLEWKDMDDKEETDG